jgi:serine/threonine protein kinase
VTTPADPRLGTRLAGYQIQAPLGRGGMGVVYLAEQLGPRRQVALKLLLDPAAAGAGFRERFLRESELAAAIDHPNVLPVYDAGESEGVLWIAMRYVPSIDLAALLDRDGPLAPEQGLAIIGPVAGGVGCRSCPRAGPPRRQAGQHPAGGGGRGGRPGVSG